jgi:hypothetical protein
MNKDPQRDEIDAETPSKNKPDKQFMSMFIQNNSMLNP